MKISLTKFSNNENITLDELFEEFIRNCKVNSLTERTIMKYTDTYNRFKKLFDEDYEEDTILCKDLNEKYIEWFIMKLREVNENIKDNAINSYLRDIRTLINYGIKQEYIKPFKVELIKAVEEVPITFTYYELQKILKKPDMKKCNFEEYRNWVIAVYMLSTANRANTVINLKIKDIDLDNEDLLLGTLKNKKQQYIPMAKN